MFALQALRLLQMRTITFIVHSIVLEQGGNQISPSLYGLNISQGWRPTKVSPGHRSQIYLISLQLIIPSDPKKPGFIP